MKIQQNQKKSVKQMLCDFLIYGVVRGAIASQNRLARQCEAGEVPIASELGDAAYLWPTDETKTEPEQETEP